MISLANRYSLPIMFFRSGAVTAGAPTPRIDQFARKGLLLLFAVVCVHDGLGVEYRLFDFQFFADYGILVAIALVVVAMLLAWYWGVATT
jgi:hypothetical protein